MIRLVAILISTLGIALVARACTEQPRPMPPTDVKVEVTSV